MLFVINKDKIISYFIAFSTVAVILGISAISLINKSTIETSSNQIKKTNVNNEINAINKE